MERIIAFHIGNLQSEFQSNLYNEYFIQNIDGTYFVINHDNG